MRKKRKQPEPPTYSWAEHEQHRQETERKQREEAAKRKEEVAKSHARRRFIAEGAYVDEESFDKAWKAEIWPQLQAEELGARLEDAAQRDKRARQAMRQMPGSRI